MKTLIGNKLYSTSIQHILDPGFTRGVLSNRLCPLVRGPSVRPWSVGPSLNISETVHWFFLIFCMKLVHQKGRKVTQPYFEKNLGGSEIWENYIIGVFLKIFAYISGSSH